MVAKGFGVLGWTQKGTIGGVGIEFLGLVHTFATLIVTLLHGNKFCLLVFLCGRLTTFHLREGHISAE